MQWILFALSYIMLVTARSRRENNEEYGIEGFAQPHRSQASLESQLSDFWTPQRYQGRDLYEILNELDEGTDTSEPQIANKRALSVLSRWRPFGSLGLRANTISKDHSRAPLRTRIPDGDIVSAQTRGNYVQVTQPLRWGRKR